MRPCDYAPLSEGRCVKAADMIWCAEAALEADHLVEVAVVKGPVMADRDRRAAHDVPGGLRVKEACEPLHVSREVAGAFQKIAEPAYRHVGYGEKPCEADPVPLCEFPLEICLYRPLARRQIRAARIIDEVQLEPAPLTAVPNGVKPFNSLDGPIEDPLAPLPVNGLLEIIRKGRDDLDPIFSEEARQVLKAFFK